MTGRSRTPSSDGTTPRRLDIQRIRVDAKGYDASGAYWGAGQDVFIATTPDGKEEVTVRARNVAEARRKAAAELARPAGDARSKREPPLDQEPGAGNSAHKTRHEIDWVNPVTGETVRIRITHARDYLSTGNDHIEVESVKPSRAPLPITETGYRSHFMPALDLINAGGPVTFVTAWITQEAKSKTWSNAAATKAQGDLFQWARARAETGKRAASKSAKRPTAKPRKRRAHVAEND